VEAQSEQVVRPYDEDLHFRRLAGNIFFGHDIWVLDAMMEYVYFDHLAPVLHMVEEDIPVGNSGV
jgi:hypothetical protein